MTLLVCGSREWTDSGIIEAALNYAVREWGVKYVMHGDARGADKIAGRIALRLRLGVLAVPANWKRDGKAAGPIRNQRMLAAFNLDCVLAFHDDPQLGKGTKDMVSRALKAGIPVYLCTTEQPTPTLIAELVAP